MPYLFCSQRLGGRTLRSGSVDKPVMGAFCAGSYEVTPPGRLRATTSSAGPTDRPKDSSTRQAYGESDPAEDVSHILTGLRDVDPERADLAVRCRGRFAHATTLPIIAVRSCPRWVQTQAP
jgi:hypothetical protein